jgi:hypothetical protein
MRLAEVNKASDVEDKKESLKQHVLSDDGKVLMTD